MAEHMDPGSGAEKKPVGGNGDNRSKADQGAWIDSPDEELFLHR